NEGKLEPVSDCATVRSSHRGEVRSKELPRPTDVRNDCNSRGEWSLGRFTRFAPNVQRTKTKPTLSEKLNRENKNKWSRRRIVQPQSQQLNGRERPLQVYPQFLSTNSSKKYSYKKKKKK
ncbi:hypothetical protein IscW_ISCW006976, partial [Ixodes scapularis]